VLGHRNYLLFKKFFTSNDLGSSTQGSEGRVMTYYENLIKHVHAAMEKHPRSPVVMITDTFRVVASGKNTGKMAIAIKKYGALGRMTAVFQKPSENQTFIY